VSGRRLRFAGALCRPPHPPANPAGLPVLAPLALRCAPAARRDQLGGCAVYVVASTTRAERAGCGSERGHLAGHLGEDFRRCGRV